MSFFAGDLIFPFYILFIKNIGSSYTQFGLSYGLFGLSGALIHPAARPAVGKTGFPLVPYGKFVGDGGASSDAPAHYRRAPGLCCAGAFGPVRRDAKTRRENHDRRLHRRRGAGKKVGDYHFWTAVFSVAAIILGGFLADFFTVYIIFYASSVLFFISGLMMLKKTG